MTKTIIALAAAFMLGLSLGHLTTQPVSAATAHENADQVAGVAVYLHAKSIANSSHAIGTGGDPLFALDLCQTRLHLTPDMAELRDVQACSFRVLEWARWWDRAARGFAGDARGK